MAASMYCRRLCLQKKWVFLHLHPRCRLFSLQHNIKQSFITKNGEPINTWFKFSRCAPQVSFRNHSSGSLGERKCWKCGRNTKAKEELFFCHCGVVQSVPTDLNLFEALGLEESFDIDTVKLSATYKGLQRNLHPDRYTQKSDEERQRADEQSAYLNKAYWTLLKPLSRGLYLLQLHGEDIEETNTSVDQAFLMEIMEINEALGENPSQDTVKMIEEENEVKLCQCVVKLSGLFKEKNIQEAKKILVRLKYFANIDDKVKEIYRKAMG